MTIPPKPHLEKFRECLKEIPLQNLSQATRWRYANGDLPKGILWLLNHPQLLRALADDAERNQTAESTTPSY